MFGRKAPTAVGGSSTLRGDLECGRDDLVVAGLTEGTIHSEATVTVAPGGRVVGDITARAVVVGGLVEGTVTALEQLSMRATGRIDGDARYGALEVDRGGVIEGRATPLHEEAESASEAGDGTKLLAEGASRVEETLQFKTPLSTSLTEVDDQKSVSLPTKGKPPSPGRPTDPWVGGERAGSEEPLSNEGAGGDKELSKATDS